jgi:hypothetical protein
MQVVVADGPVHQEVEQVAQAGVALDILPRPRQLHKLLELLILGAGVVEQMTPAQAHQAVQASSSLNTTHPHNPYSHSKVPASG